MELGAFIACGAAGSPTDHALACLFGLPGRRVSEACSIDIDDLGSERGHRIVTLLGKGAKVAVIPPAAAHHASYIRDAFIAGAS